MLNDPKYSEEVTLRKVINKFGKEAQCRQVMEECAELIQATNKMLRDRGKEQHENLIEEMADVQIMLEQLKIMFAVEEDRIQNYRMEKVEALRKLINL